MKPLKIAVEYERILHRLDGTVANLADSFLDHPSNIESKNPLVSEASLVQIEYNSPPRVSLDDLCKDILEAEEVSDSISPLLEVISIPISETGAGKSTINQDEHIQNRLTGYKVIFGEEMAKRLTKISGVHIHIDQYKPRLANQYNLLLSLVPTIALTSTSSISDEGMNSENCHRYKLFADSKDGLFHDIPEEKGYIGSIEELLARDRKRYDSWKREFDANMWRSPNIPEDYTFGKYFKPHNTGYSEVRYRPDVGNGTFELRFNDSTPADILMGQTALVLGYVSRVLENDIPVYIAEENDTYKFAEDEVMLPNKETLYKYTELGIESEEVRTYLNSIESFARVYLEAKGQQHYLNPIREIIDSGENVASQMLDHLGEHKLRYTPQEAAQANLFVWERHRQGIESLRQKSEYNRE